MIKTREIEMPVLDQELFRLLYAKNKRDDAPPNESILRESVLPNEIIFHARSNREWSLARVNYNDGLVAVVCHNKMEWSKATFYDNCQVLGSVATSECRDGLYVDIPQLSDEIIEKMATHLGGLQLLTERDELMRELDDYRDRSLDTMRTLPHWKAADREIRRVDQFLVGMIDDGVACWAKIIYRGLTGDKSIKRRGNDNERPLTLFDEDEREKARNPYAVHTAVKIKYSPELTSQVKERLRER